MKNDIDTPTSNLIEREGLDGRLKTARQGARGTLLGVIAVTSFALFAIVAGALTTWIAGGPVEGQPGGLLQGQALIVLTIALVAGGAFVILRAALSHDDVSRRLDSLCRELESSNARLEEFSFKDDLTALYNRRFFAMRLEDEVSRYARFDHPLSLVLLDIDDFKAVNDDLGHAAGDETLREVAETLQRNTRSIDVISRYGGDEFAILLVETPKEGALFYAERMRRRIEARAFRHGRTVTVSMGVACLPEDVGPVPDDLIATADAALYEAKRGGKNRVAEREGEVATERVRRGGWNL